MQLGTNPYSLEGEMDAIQGQQATCNNTETLWVHLKFKYSEGVGVEIQASVMDPMQIFPAAR